jgi:capsular exopolysaccharide synthesis family protein
VTPREYIDVVRERWRFIVAALLLGLGAAAAAIYLVPREYAASATVIVSPQPGADPTGSSDDAEISGQRLGIYGELLNSTRLTRDVVSDLRLATTPEELAGRIAVTTSPDSVLLTATVTDRTPDGAVSIANAVADQFIRNVAEIEQPADPLRPPPVVGKVFEAAQPPADQVAPRPSLYLALGVVLGLVLGIGSALLRHALDFRIKNRRQLEESLRAPVLGIMGRDPKIPSSPLVMYGAPRTPLAEAFRQLRTNVQFVDVDRRHKVILVTSATAGEGRSTTVCNLGLALAEAGTRVLVVDADLREPAIARCLSIDGSVGLTDVLANRIPVGRALQAVGPTLDVLPSGVIPPNPSELLGSNRMVNLLATLREKYDVILIDAAPLIPVTDAAVLAPRVDGVLVVVRHGRTVVHEVQAAKDALDAVSGRILGSVLTMVPHGGGGTHTRRKAKRGRSQQSALGDVPTDASPRTTGEAGGGPRLPDEARPAGPAPAPRQPTPVPRPPVAVEADTQVLDRGGSTAR